MARRGDTVRTADNDDWLAGAGRERRAGAWYVVATGLDCSEAKAAERIERLGFPAHVPLMLRETRHGRGLDIRQEVMFPGYLLVRFAADEAWGAILHLRGVDGIVGMGPRHPVPLAEPVVLALQEAEGVVQRAPVLVTMQVGDVVRIADGLWCGHVGELLALDSAGRIIVLMNLFGRKTRVLSRLEQVSLEKLSAEKI